MELFPWTFVVMLIFLGALFFCQELRLKPLKKMTKQSHPMVCLAAVLVLSIALHDLPQQMQLFQLFMLKYSFLVCEINLLLPPCWPDSEKVNS